MEVLLPVLVGNLVLAACLAGVAYTVHRSGREPRLAHLLWVVVLLKLVTPPLLALPSGVLADINAALVGLPAVGSASATAATAAGATGGRSIAEIVAALVAPATTVFMATWVAGSLVVLVASLIRVHRFERSLAQAARPASAEIREAGRLAAARLGLRSMPSIEVTEARLSPMTWWTGGQVRVLIPAGLCDELDLGRLRWILAHELAHVKRRDHLVRWLEWLVGTVFWWNPLVWWVRRCLHADEEAACDALVLRRVAAGPRPYAEALLGVAVFLSGTADPSPVLATGVGTHGPLEQRFRAILTRRYERPGSRRLVLTVMSISILLASLGLQAAPRSADRSPARAIADVAVGQVSPRDTSLSSGLDRSGAVTPGHVPVPAGEAEVSTDYTTMVSASLDTALPTAEVVRAARDGHASRARQLRWSLARVDRALEPARRAVREALRIGDPLAAASERARLRDLRARAARLEARLERLRVVTSGD
jgi:beta-lactamase regulating signal transducer with metallopeptidase domain